MNGRIGTAIVALVGALAIPLITPQAQQLNESNAAFVPAELIVQFEPAVSELARNRTLTDRGARSLRRFPALNSDHVRLPPGQDVAAAMAAFRRQPGVARVQPNFIRRIVAPASPNDPYWLAGYLWGLDRIQAQSVWTSFTTGAPDVVVAAIDTGVDYRHQDLAANMWVNRGEVAGNRRDDDRNGYVDDVFGIDAMNRDSDPMDDHGHGTHTAGTIGATGNNGTGVVGVAWGSRILACKFLDRLGRGTDAGAIECFNYIIDLKRRGIDIRVSNNSWGSPREGQPAAVLQAAIDEAGDSGILNVFAAGNDGTDNDATPFDPASFPSPSIVSVAASDDTDGRPAFSNYGAASVDLAAPGDFILSTASGSYSFSSGTSMAAPHVAGSAALLASRDSSLSVETIKELLTQTVDVLPQWAGVVASGGRLNLSSAASAVGGNLGPRVTLTRPEAGSSFQMPATVSLEATASDMDGTVSRVDFHANGVLVATAAAGTTGVFTGGWTPTLAGAYSLTAVATDNGGVSRTSSAVNVSIVPPAGRVNVALAANGGSAAASSVLDSGYAESSVINGDRKGLGWGSGGGWADATTGTWPDWLEVRFGGPQSIEEIGIFTVQDNFSAPSDPTSAMTFTQWGVRGFVVEYWTGTSWQTIPGGSVSENTNVWRRFHFTPLTTSRVRVWITDGLASNSRLTEVEAYAVLGSENLAPSVTLTSPAAGASFVASSPVALAATASDPDGTIARVDFYANGAHIAGDSSAVDGLFGITWTPTAAGSYSLAAVATDDRGGTRMSSLVPVTITPRPENRVNVARAANGAVAVASSTYSSGYPQGSVIDGDRKGMAWGSGGGWADGTPSAWPDWLEVRFNGQQTIEQIDLFTVQDNFANPSDPTLAMTFTQWGVRDFVVEYWTGTSWQPIPGGSVAGNKNVWRQFQFAPVTASRIRVWITQGLASSSRLTEIEAYAVLGSENLGPTVTLTSPASGASFVASSAIALEATASDADGPVARVDFFANGTQIGTDTSVTNGLYALTWTPSTAGTYSLAAVAVDDRGATGTSSPVAITITPRPDNRVNVARAVNGGVALASSMYASGYPAGSVIDGDRKGVGWGSGGGWADGTPSVWPDWLEVQFSGQHAIEQIDLFTVQDNFANPSEPTSAMTFTQWGVRDFVVEYWTGSSWQPVPDGSVAGNNRVWRQFQFTPVTTSRIRVRITQGLASSSRLTEVEAYAIPPAK